MVLMFHTEMQKNWDIDISIVNDVSHGDAENDVDNEMGIGGVLVLMFHTKMQKILVTFQC